MSEKIKELRRWTAICRISQNTFPGKRVTYLYGSVFNDPDREDGQDITTSPVVDIDIENKIATTYSCSKYLLGESGIRISKKLISDFKEFKDGAWQ